MSESSHISHYVSSFKADFKVLQNWPGCIVAGRTSVFQSNIY